MITSEALDFMIQEITMGIPKKESVVLMTAEASDVWDRLEVQIAEIKDAGGQVEIPFELPSVDIVKRSEVVEVVE